MESDSEDEIENAYRKRVATNAPAATPAAAPAIPDTLPFTLAITNNTGMQDTEQVASNKPVKLDHGCTIAVTWSVGKPVDPDVLEDASANIKASVVDTTLTMDECFRSFCRKEHLSADNLWCAA
jgi:hypothetical protein